MWLGRWAKWSCRSYFKTESDRSKLFDDQRSYLFYHVVLDTKLQALRDECFSREHFCQAAFLFICKIIEKDSNLVDSASSIRLSQRLSHARLSISDYTVKLRMAHYISYSLFDGPCYLDNRSNSRANTCIKPWLFGRGVFIRWKPIRGNPVHGDS